MTTLTSSLSSEMIHEVERLCKWHRLDDILEDDRYKPHASGILAALSHVIQLRLCFDQLLDFEPNGIDQQLELAEARRSVVRDLCECLDKLE